MHLFKNLLSLLKSEIESIVQDQKQVAFWESNNPSKTILFEVLSQEMIDKINQEKAHKQKVLAEWLEILALFNLIESKLETISNPDFELPDQELPDQVIPDCNCDSKSTEDSTTDEDEYNFETEYPTHYDLVNY